MSGPLPPRIPAVRRHRSGDDGPHGVIQDSSVVSYEDVQRLTQSTDDVVVSWGMVRVIPIDQDEPARNWTIYEEPRVQCYSLAQSDPADLTTMLIDDVVAQWGRGRFKVKGCIRDWNASYDRQPMGVSPGLANPTMRGRARGIVATTVDIAVKTRTVRQIGLGEKLRVMTAYGIQICEGWPMRQAIPDFMPIIQSQDIDVVNVDAFEFAARTVPVPDYVDVVEVHRGFATDFDGRLGIAFYDAIGTRIALSLGTFDVGANGQYLPGFFRVPVPWLAVRAVAYWVGGDLPVGTVSVRWEGAW